MATYLRYALATFCFAASVGCLALWWRSMTHIETFTFARPKTPYATVRCSRGYFFVTVSSNHKSYSVNTYYSKTAESQSIIVHEVNRTGRYFGEVQGLRFYPLWYPALIFVLAGVAALRLGRRFTIRSAIIATTVVAGLLGVAVRM